MAHAGNWLARAWRQRGLVACLLWPASILYGVIFALHRWLYRVGVFKTKRCAVPVIVVGNVVAGGAGKTPLVIALAKHLQRQGWQVGVVSRGYGRHANNCAEVLENTPISASGDEPALIFSALAAPVFVANRRIDAAQSLLAKYPATQLIISDDGLQHHALARDVEITVFDDRGVGNGWLLPAGPLRERFKTGQLSKKLEPNPAQSFVKSLILHTGQSPAFGGYVSSRRLADNAVASDGHLVRLNDLQCKPVIALAGIASPDAFFNMLEARGLQLTQRISLPDHFDFAHYTLPVPTDSTLLCTEKDAVKLFKMQLSHDVRLLAVPLEFTPEPAFFKALDALLVQHRPVNLSVSNRTNGY